ncbi:hypothetical protein AQUCO_00900404v1 [Aquilegia coerulea]|uniref:Uncharacterized protein n=1 Tax=Aquilegia coerulea TaxID=218851 RepID=A0A2G5EDF1_AQUCA|nr:hypothetical protein AQUCO_00900404v1 [Aquilegia coerulea]
MRRILLKSFPVCVRHFNCSNTLKPISTKLLVLPLSSTQSNFKFFSSDNNFSNPNPNGKALISSNEKTLISSKDNSSDIEDVSNEEFSAMLEKFYEEDDNEEQIPTIMEAILRRKISGKHEETDDELLETLKRENLSNNVGDEDEDSELDGSGSDEDSNSDSDLDGSGGDLQNARSYWEKKLKETDKI